MTIASTVNKKPAQWWHIWSCKHCADDDKSTVTREIILMAAFDEIYQRGFQAASLSNILKNTATTKGALYHHFKNKMELGYAVIDEVIRETIEVNWIDPLNETDDPITTIKQILMEYGDQMSAGDVRLGCPLNNIAQEMSPIDEGFRERISSIYTLWQTAMEDACERGKVAGNLNKDVDSRQISLLFVATLEGCLGFAKSTQSLNNLMICGKGLMDRLESLRPL
jgi:AcrR family transcriptional regulator